LLNTAFALGTFVIGVLCQADFQGIRGLAFFAVSTAMIGLRRYNLHRHRAAQRTAPLDLKHRIKLPNLQS